MASLSSTAAAGPIPIDCNFCNFRAPTLNFYVSHLRSVHAEDSDFHITCGIDGCVNNYQKCSSFLSHVYRNHREALLVPGSRCVSLPPASDDPATATTTNVGTEEGLFGGELYSEEHARNGDLGTATAPFDHSLHQILQEDDVQQQKRSALFLLKLKEVKGLSQSAVNVVVSGCQELFQHSVGRIQAGVGERLSMQGIDSSEIPDLDDFFSAVVDPFSGLHTTYLQDKFYRDHLNSIVLKYYK